MISLTLRMQLRLANGRRSTVRFTQLNRVRRVLKTRKKRSCVRPQPMATEAFQCRRHPTLSRYSRAEPSVTRKRVRGPSSFPGRTFQAANGTGGSNQLANQKVRRSQGIRTGG